jgi:putative transposase
MYDWRKMNERQRKQTIELRLRVHAPIHSVPHWDNGPNQYMISATCFEHRPHIGYSLERMADFEQQLLDTLEAHTAQLYCWCILPNHYHALVFTDEVKALLTRLGQLHGRTSFQWNGEENQRGRKTWFRAVETVMKSERHFWVTFNYIHNNPVKHEYVEKWQDWPFSSANIWLEKLGRTRMRGIWREYPPLDYGEDWDV